MAPFIPRCRCAHRGYDLPSGTDAIVGWSTEGEKPQTVGRDRIPPKDLMAIMFRRRHAMPPYRSRNT